MVAAEEPGSDGVAPELGPARVVPELGSGSASSVPVPSEGRSSADAGVPGVTPPLLKRHRTRERSGSGSVDRPGEGSAAASKPEVIDVEMQDDPSIPYENIADTEMDPGFFEGEGPMEVEQGVVEGNEAVGMDLGDDLPRMGDLFDEASELPMRAPRRLEQVLHPRLDVPEGLVPAIGEEKAPKLVRLVNSVLISKNARFPESLKICGSQVWLAKPSSVLSEVDGCPLDVQLAIVSVNLQFSNYGAATWIYCERTVTWSQLLTQTLLPPMVAAGMLLLHRSQKRGLRPRGIGQSRTWNLAFHLLQHVGQTELFKCRQQGLLAFATLAFLEIFCSDHLLLELQGKEEQGGACGCFGVGAPVPVSNLQAQRILAPGVKLYRV